MTTFTANEKHWRWRSEPVITRVLAILGFGAAAAFFVNSWTARAAKPDASASRAGLLHLTGDDDLVGWGWSPGEGRTLPPLSRPDTGAQVKVWIDGGAACPE